MNRKLRITRPSRFGHAKMEFLACDDGSQICAPCAEPVYGRYDDYGPVKKEGECHNCGLRVEMAEWIGGRR